MLFKAVETVVEAAEAAGDVIDITTTVSTTTVVTTTTAGGDGWSTTTSPVPNSGVALILDELVGTVVGPILFCFIVVGLIILRWKRPQAFRFIMDRLVSYLSLFQRTVLPFCLRTGCL